LGLPRGITVSYETVRRWINHFGPKIAADRRKRRPKPHTTLHLDEVYLKIDGRSVSLWHAVDADVARDLLCALLGNVMVWTPPTQRHRGAIAWSS
jgi:transposase-like protein